MANDVEFTVEETGEIQKVKMEDERAMGQLVIVKTDTDSKSSFRGSRICSAGKGNRKRSRTFEDWKRWKSSFRTTSNWNL